MLDTNIVIYTIKNKPFEVRSAFNQHEGQMCISSITTGELVYGAERSEQPEKNMQIVEGLLSRLDIFPYEYQDSIHFGQIHAELYKSGRPIRPYDMMIAAHARARGLILVTNNMKEFERVQGLRLENWVV